MLLVVGSLAYDSVETAHGKVEHALGGSATFFSIASSMFLPTSVVGVVGQDFRRGDLQRLQARGIDTSGVEVAEGHTFRWGGVYSKHFETRTTLFTELNVFAEFKPKLGPQHRDAEFLFLGNIHPALQLDVLDQCRANGGGPRFVGMDTMNFWISGERAILEKVLAQVDALFVNDEEAFALSGCGNILEAARHIHRMGPSTVIIKRGEHGAFLFHGGHALVLPAVLLDRVIDPTGAGDTFAGGFMGYLASRGSLDVETLQGAMVAGTCAASFAVEDFSVDGIERVDMAALAQRHKQLCAGLLSPVLDLQQLRGAQASAAASA